MSLYYEDEFVQLHHGRCEDVLPTLSLTGDVHLLTDPPYFQVKDDDWDNQWSKAADFLDWMGEWLGLVKPHLSANASVWVFASPQLTSAVESVVSREFRVLNSVRWVKEQGWHKKADLGSMRSFLSPWEGIVFAEQLDDAYGEAALALHRRVFAPIGRYLQSEWERAGWKAGKVGVALGYDSALPTRWSEGSSLPSSDAYERLRRLLNEGGGAYLRREYEDLRREYEDLRREYEDLRREYEDLRREYEDLRREYEDLRREYEDLRRVFTIDSRDRSTDVWFFDNVAPYPGKHPCEKPAGLLTHMIESTTRAGDTIIDCFSGSGAVLDSARQLGRKAIGIEMDAHWCSRAAQRLSQQAFDFTALEGA